MGEAKAMEQLGGFQVHVPPALAGQSAAEVGQRFLVGIRIRGSPANKE